MKTTQDKATTVSILKNGTTYKTILNEIAMFKGQEDAFYVMNLGDLINQYRIWTEMFPNIKPYYAVKCNDSLVVLRVLSSLGVNFDCASKGEISRVLSVGATADRIIFANPVKQSSHIRFAEKVGVDLLTFDSAAELYKIKEFHPLAKLILRIVADSADSQCPSMGMKFGVGPGKAVALIQIAHLLKLNLIGVSFHVGSGNREHQAYRRALGYAKDVFDCCKDFGYNLEVIDIGGGFTCESFNKTALCVNEGLDLYFPGWDGENKFTVIAEPGRFFVSKAYTLATRIHSKRVDKSNYMYYINDGLYGSFNCLLYDKAVVEPIPLKDNSSAPTFKSTIWGPTCDSLDMIAQDYPLPIMSLGDWIQFDSMGAYTITASTSFNGFELPKVHHVADIETWNLLKDIIPDLFTFDEKPFWIEKEKIKTEI